MAKIVIFILGFIFGIVVVFVAACMKLSGDMSDEEWEAEIKRLHNIK